MNVFTIVNGLVYIDRSFQRKNIAVRDGKISVLPPDSAVTGDVTDAGGMRIVPGFVDIHTHGAVGVDVNSADVAGLGRMADFFASHGTTSFLMSVLTDSEEQTRRCISACLEYRAGQRIGAELLGVHLEGPFLSSEYKGAMPEQLLRPCDRALAEGYADMAGGALRYITIAPELPGAAELTKLLTGRGITVAIGHSAAGYAAASAAIDAGAAACTHTFNAMRLLHQHEPAILGAALERDEVSCELICDGRHLHPAVVRLCCKIKGMNRVIAVTDSIMAAGLPDGNYKLGVNDVVVKDGDAKLPDGTRAGSTLTQDTALKNLLAWTGLPLEAVLPALTENPAKLIGAFDTKGSIADGKDADLVILDADNNVSAVCVKGVFVRESAKD